MKGYGYGIWIVYDQDIFQPTVTKLKHTGHFTVACFMEKEDALNLYVEILDKIGNNLTIHVSKNYEIYEKNMYEKDENDICSWGYNGTSNCNGNNGTSHNNGTSSNKWPMLKMVCQKYDCNFSHQIHTSIQYAKDMAQLTPSYLDQDMTVTGSIHLVNICSADPKDWHIIL
jgi:hypothetical protein